MSASMVYREHTVQLISTQDPDTGKWTPKATVIYDAAGKTHLQDVGLERALDTERGANAGRIRGGQSVD